MPAFPDPSEATPFRASQPPPAGPAPSQSNDGAQAAWVHRAVQPPTPSQSYGDESTRPTLDDEQTADADAMFGAQSTPFEQGVPAAWGDHGHHRPSPPPPPAPPAATQIAEPTQVAAPAHFATPATGENAWPAQPRAVGSPGYGQLGRHHEADAAPLGVRPPNPLESQHDWPKATGQAAPEPKPAPTPEPEPTPERRTQAYEVVWKGDDRDALSRARGWALENAKRPRGLVPRMGRAALVEPRPRPDDWWLGERSERISTLVNGERSLLDGGGATLRRPALVVRGVLEISTGLADRLAALRAALQHLRGQHKPIREALDLTKDIQGDELTPTAVLKGGMDDLLRAAESAGLKRNHLEDSARAVLVRARRYREVNVLGADHLVTVWRDATGLSTSQIAYLPLSAKSNLPLVGTFEARAVVTLHPRQDPEEEGPVAMRIHALGRKISAEELGEQAAHSRAGS